MRFLLDAHIARSIGRALESRGHDVLSASVANATWSDSRLLELAVSAKRVLVTEDSDFSELIFRDGASAPPAMLYLRCEPAEQPLMAERVLMVLENVDVTNHILVIRPKDFRLRPFPNARNDNG